MLILYQLSDLNKTLTFLNIRPILLNNYIAYLINRFTFLYEQINVNFLNLLFKNQQSSNYGTNSF